ncbi:hypothetical protein M422DRAFT_263396 [Sphaerobolus stellatus SS14]|uniref:Unplaced genomic scaffold SPHSTscaffold_124, whole genome shotgun sequence n=1 Tax=Sphaerobolus stellatus (strain SS14) TaxID=990650 RepID=A0A0C9UYV2_SPHS4|nr:hypothetical protein M422DRAFT_263396 [Sphaerobolus stellatus SS14]
MTLSMVTLYSIAWKVFAVYFVLKGVARVIRRRLIKSLTIIDDLPKLGVSRPPNQRIKGTAVICGGSISGLLSAKICSDHFDDVIIIEPEEWLLSDQGLYPQPEKAMDKKTMINPRARIPQWFVAQAFHPTLAIVLSKLFPGDLEKEVARAGGKIVPWEVIILRAGKALPWIPEPDMITIPVTRAAYEAIIRRLVLKTPNIKQMSGRAVGLVGSHGKITGVKRRTTDNQEDVISASLVVDCTGVALGGFQWLQEFLGPNHLSTKHLISLKETFNHKYYAMSCFFKVTDALLDEMDEAGIPGIKAGLFEYIFLPNLNTDTRSLVFWSLEKNIVSISCCGYDMQEEINDFDDLRRFYGSMVMEKPLPQYTYTLLDILERHNIPFSKYGVRTPHPVYIRYAQAKDLPQNFIAIGDAAMQFNPIKGQGVAKATTEVVTLNKLLLQSKGDILPDDFGKTFFKLQQTRTGGSWDSYKSEDYTIPTTVPVVGEVPSKVGAGLRKYMDHLWPVALEDPEVAAVLIHVMSWTRPATDMFSPQILLKILKRKFTSFVT